jgi:hypothetical protein
LVYETEEYQGYTIEIHPDETPSSPREDDNLTTMVCFHTKYDLGDKHDYRSEDYSGWQEVHDAIVKNEKPLIIYPLYLYDHSGITIRISETGGNPFSGIDYGGWDSGMVGFVYVTRERMEELGAPEESIDKQLRAEVDEYDQYLLGDIWGYVIKGPRRKCNLGHTHRETEESCWGFYGMKAAYEEARSQIDAMVRVNHEPAPDTFTLIEAKCQTVIEDDTATTKEKELATELMKILKGGGANGPPS